MTTRMNAVLRLTVRFLKDDELWTTQRRTQNREPLACRSIRLPGCFSFSESAFSGLLSNSRSDALLWSVQLHWSMSAHRILVLNLPHLLQLSFINSALYNESFLAVPTRFQCWVVCLSVCFPPDNLRHFAVIIILQWNAVAAKPCIIFSFHSEARFLSALFANFASSQALVNVKTPCVKSPLS